MNTNGHEAEARPANLKPQMNADEHRFEGAQAEARTSADEGGHGVNRPTLEINPAAWVGEDRGPKSEVRSPKPESGNSEGGRRSRSEPPHLVRTILKNEEQQSSAQ